MLKSPNLKESSSSFLIFEVLFKQNKSHMTQDFSLCKFQKDFEKDIISERLDVKG